MNVGFIGCGQMASALAQGIAANLSAVSLAGFDPNSMTLSNLAKKLDSTGTKFLTFRSNQDVIERSDYVIVAVKPQSVESALDGISSSENKVFVSVVAGVKISELESYIQNASVIRAMPNTPCLIGCGATALSVSKGINASQLEFTTAVFESVGKVVVVDEKMMDAVTGLSGSGPAYVYTFIESLIDAGVLSGLPRPLARELTLQTIIGSAEMVKQSSESPATLRDKVTSPGGTTIHGMQRLEQMGFRGSILAAVEAATKRSRDLGS